MLWCHALWVLHFVVPNLCFHALWFYAFVVPRMFHVYLIAVSQGSMFYFHLHGDIWLEAKDSGKLALSQLVTLELLALHPKAVDDEVLVQRLQHLQNQKRSKKEGGNTSESERANEREGKPPERRERRIREE